MKIGGRGQNPLYVPLFLGGHLDALLMGKHIPYTGEMFPQVFPKGGHGKHGECTLALQVQEMCPFPPSPYGTLRILNDI